LRRQLPGEYDREAAYQLPLVPVDRMLVGCPPGGHRSNHIAANQQILLNKARTRKPDFENRFWFTSALLVTLSIRMQTQDTIDQWPTAKTLCDLCALGAKLRYQDSNARYSHVKTGKSVGLIDEKCE
jgi:hypothetical protein